MPYYSLARSIAFSITFCIAAAPTIFAQAIPERTYTAVGVVGIDPATPLDPAAITLEQKTQAVLMSSDRLLTAALENPASDIRHTRWLAGFKDDIAATKKDFNQRFKVTPIPDTRLIRIEFTCDDLKDCKIIVDEIVDLHMKNQREIALARLQERCVELAELLHHLRTKIADIDTTLGQYRRQITLAGVITNGKISGDEYRLEQFNHMLNLEMQSRDLRLKFEQLQVALERGDEPSVVSEMVARDITVSALRKEIDRSEGKLVKLEGTVEENDQQLLAMRSYLAKIKQRSADAENESRLRARNLILDRAKFAASQAKEEFDTAKANLAELSNILAKYEALLEEGKSLRDRAKPVEIELDTLTMQARNARGPVVWMEHPTVGQ